MATTTARLPARSVNGCWTCRLRRKKCDERRPSCSTCVSLELDCHGYGPKPLWMDHGALQKAQALEFKRIVSQTKSKKLRRRPLHTTYPSQDFDVLQSDQSSSEAFTPLIPEAQTPRTHTGNTFQDNSQFPICGIHTRTFGTLAWDSDFDETTSPSQQFCFQNENLPTASGEEIPDPLGISNSDLDMDLLFSQPQSPSTWPTGLEYSLWCNERPSKNNTLSRKNATSHGSLSLVNYEDSFIFDGSIRYDSLKNQFIHQASLNDTQDLISEGNSSLTFTPSSNFESQAAGQGISNWGGDTEDCLLMYYLDHIFHIQFSYYNSFKGQKRGWLFSILTRAKSAYHATLALSEQYQHSTTYQNLNIAGSSDLLRNKGGHYDLALEAIQHSLEKSDTLSGMSDLTRSIHLLTAILQLLSLELFTSGTNNWQRYLCAAATLLPALVHARTVSIASALSINQHEKGCQDETVLHGDNNTAVKFLLGSFISLDIMAAASTRCRPILGIDHSLVVEKLEIDLNNITACENWVIILILEISRLDTWKSEAEANHKLSIVELARRGHEIRERLRRPLADIDLRQRLSEIDIPSSTKFSPKDLSKLQTRRNHLETTKIFALSAVTYLNVVLSGANPDLPEITESVSNTIAAFKTIEDLKLLSNLAWPFCVTGCLALKEQYSTLRGLMSAANAKTRDLRTYAKAFEIIEECWRARQAGSREIDWVSVMENSGCYVLLA